MSLTPLFSPSGLTFSYVCLLAIEIEVQKALKGRTTSLIAVLFEREQITPK